MRWLVVYGDFTTYGDEGDGRRRAYDAPGRNVQAILLPDPDHNYEVLTPIYGGGGYYVYLPEKDTWRLVDQAGWWDYLFEARQQRTLFGRTLDNDEFKAVIDFANGIAGTKTGRWPHERKP
jgi:hypothetical protein